MRRGRQPRGQRIDQILFPGLALDLPDAEANEHGQHRERRDGGEELEHRVAPERVERAEVEGEDEVRDPDPLNRGLQRADR